jgi:hypothetical protein
MISEIGRSPAIKTGLEENEDVQAEVEEIEFQPELSFRSNR